MKNSYYIAIDDKERSRIIQSNRLDLSHHKTSSINFPSLSRAENSLDFRSDLTV